MRRKTRFLQGEEQNKRFDNEVAEPWSSFKNMGGLVVGGDMMFLKTQ